ncbi:DUF6232 family protein [Phytohabitans rumicis]|uniref:Uncharacterized protein n=1 Tax=Phytohabitans rumicis TaxID=1076125 RepID=A0A6V8KTM3_9ACTN|nr:DUF6232 family protein [Phytohabitans rumicis]GFJ86780.1 hypothetical protein Prum_004220 [Phytohabitans rumicis]
MRIFYDDGDVRVTSAAIWVRGHRYRLVEMDRIWRQTSAAVGRRAARGLAVLATAMLAKLAVGAFGVLAGLALSSPVTAVALSGLEDVRRYGRRLELWASVGDLPVLLLATDDAIRYGQVCRSLVRAMDDLEDFAVAAWHRPGVPGRLWCH